MKFYAAFLLAALLVSGYAIPVESTTKNVDVTVTSGGTSDEEFVGPFPNWVNVKTGKRVDGTGSTVCTGSAGNGSTDDTAAWQSCLNILGSSTPALWIPVGSYKINHTLSLINQIYVNIIGEDPTTTIILWGGTGATAANFTGTISAASGTYATLTVSSVTGYLTPGQVLHGTSVPANAYITASTGANTYRLDTLTGGGFSNVGPAAMTTTDEAMLYLNGNVYSRFDRLTFDGQNNAAVAVDQSYDAITQFDTGNQYADDTFKNSGIGMRCGNLGAGCAETAMLRPTVTNNSVIGINMRDFNALNMWVWYGFFQNNAISVGNNPGAGNFHVYNSVLLNSTTSDFDISNTGGFDIRNNYSSGSQYFLAPAHGQSTQANITIQGNTILDYTGGVVIQVGNLGPLILIDNRIRSLAGTTTAASPVAHLVTGLPADMFSMGNTFTAGTIQASCATSSSTGNGGPIAASNVAAPPQSTCHEVNDQVVSIATFNAMFDTNAPTLPPTPPNNSRAIFEAAPSGSGSTCSAAAPCSVQTAITQAAASVDVNPVVHILAGSYSVATTITVPANRRMQLVGDGGTSSLNKGGADPILKLLGPSRATLSNFFVNGVDATPVGIEIDGIDAVGSRVFGEGVIMATSSTNMAVGAMNYAHVEFHNMQNLYDGGSAGPGITVAGGGASGGSFNVYGGLAAGRDLSFAVSGSANVNIYGVWNEITAGVGTRVLTLSGNGTTTYAGSVFGVPCSTSNAAALSGFTGTAAFVGLHANNLCGGSSGNYNITGNGSGGNVLGLGLVGQFSPFWSDTTSPADTSKFLNGSLNNSGPLTEIGTADPTFLATTLRQMRINNPLAPGALPTGVTDVRLYRVFTSAHATGIHLVP